MEPDDLLLISDYLANSLSEEDQKSVEHRLKEDEGFAAMFKEREAQLAILKAVHRAEVKANLNRQFNAYRRTQGGKRRIWMISAIAASIGLVLLFWLRPWQVQVSPEQLAMTYLEPFPADLDRGPSQIEQSVRDSAFQLYREEKYTSALPLFQQLHILSPSDDTITMYLAESLSHTGQYLEAAELFKSLSGDSLFPDAAQWRWALNLLLGGEKDQAVNILKEIRDGSHYKSREAKKLLELMNV